MKALSKLTKDLQQNFAFLYKNVQTTNKNDVKRAVGIVLEIVACPALERVFWSKSIQKASKQAFRWKPHTSVVADDLGAQQTKRNTKVILLNSRKNGHKNDKLMIVILLVVYVVHPSSEFEWA